MSSLESKPGVSRTCAFCGKAFAGHLKRCPFCREENPAVRPLSRPRGPDGRAQIRRGLLCMFLGAVIYYFFVAGYGAPLELPGSFIPVATNYLAPLFFLGGLVYALYGLFLRIKS